MPEQAIVNPLPHAARVYKQSQFDALPGVPMRMLISGRSASGKGTLISSLVLDHYRGVFKHIIIFSATAQLDPVWKDIAAYARTELGQGKTDDPASIPFIYDQFSAGALRHIIDKQRESRQQQTEDKRKTLKGCTSSSTTCHTTAKCASTKQE